VAKPPGLIVRGLKTKLSAVHKGGETLSFMAHLNHSISSSAISAAVWTGY